MEVTGPEEGRQKTNSSSAIRTSHWFHYKILKVKSGDLLKWTFNFFYKLKCESVDIPYQN